MDIGWTEFGRYLGGAFALYLVLEGIVPFSTATVSNYGIGGAAPTYRSSLDELQLGSIPL